MLHLSGHRRLSEHSPHRGDVPPPPEVSTTQQRDATPRADAPVAGVNNNDYSADDVAVYIDDSFTDAIARQVLGMPPLAAMKGGDGRALPTPTALALLSPQRVSHVHHSGDYAAMCRRSVRPPLKGLFAENCSPPDRQISACVAPAPSPPRATVVTAAMFDVVVANERLQAQLDHQKAVCQATLDRHVEDYQKLQSKISEVIALTSRLEESKRFIRQLKREMLENRQRHLPLINTHIEMQRQIAELAEARCRELVAAERERFDKELAEADRRVKCLEDIVQELDTPAALLLEEKATPPREGSEPEASLVGRPTRRGPSMTVSLLRRTFVAMDHLQEELAYERHERGREMDRRRRLERAVDEATRLQRETDVELQEYRRRSREDRDRTDEYVRALRSAVKQLYADKEESSRLLDGHSASPPQAASSSISQLSPIEPKPDADI